MTRFPHAAKLVLPVVLAALAAPSLSQLPATPPGALDKTRVTAGNYTVDATHSMIAWRVNHLGFNDYFGLFGQLGGSMTFDPANPAATKLTATIPVSKVVTVDQALTGHLLKPGADGAKPDFFGPAAPDAVFTSTKVTPGADGMSAAVEGTLTLNGVTKPATFTARFAGAGTNFFNKAPTIGFHGESTIKRSDFGLGFFAPLVGDEVKLEITIAFEKK
ncbi:polyisoprenoid-binding protein [Novosphingobium sediminis]|uniref:Polyisoprenoid-binding protein n=1 Tax=Novosphingobium sediminis TaxID=707214 RepID=A0A512AGH9_9SPHN|nr:YceI family protein [Novosphingobium sediminis]GEN98811.1 polyisoprenoid-binding protein [Novosphingobium sediminis]